MPAATCCCCCCCCCPLLSAADLSSTQIFNSGRTDAATIMPLSSICALPGRPLPDLANCISCCWSCSTQHSRCHCLCHSIFAFLWYNISNKYANISPLKFPLKTKSDCSISVRGGLGVHMHPKSWHCQNWVDPPTPTP